MWIKTRFNQTSTEQWSSLWIPFEHPLCPLNYGFSNGRACPHCIQIFLVPHTILGTRNALNKCLENEQCTQHTRQAFSLGQREHQGSCTAYGYVLLRLNSLSFTTQMLLNLFLQTLLLKIWWIWAQNDISKSPVPKHMAHQKCLPLFTVLLHWNMIMPGRERRVFSGIQFSCSLAPSISLFARADASVMPPLTDGGWTAPITAACESLVRLSRRDSSLLLF